MTALAVHASHAAQVPHLSWPRVGAWSGSFSLHLLILAVLLTPPVALQISKRMPTPDPIARIIEVIPPTVVPDLPTPVRHQPIAPVRRVAEPPVAPPLISEHSEMAIPTQVTEAPPAIESRPVVADSEPTAIAYGTKTRVSYPRDSLLNHEQGTVVLRVLVSAQGLAQAVEIEKTSGFIRLDRAARDAVKGWSFHLAIRNGAAQSAWALVPVTFNLQQL